MLRLTEVPDPAPEAMRAYYRTIYENGAVLSVRIANARYGIADSFDPAWGVDAVTWIGGGEERYDFQSGERMRLGSSGMLTISRGARYAYAAESDAPFHACMIVFPDAMRRTLCSHSAAGASHSSPAGLRTALARPDSDCAGQLAAIDAVCRLGEPHPGWLEERVTLLYERLLAAQERRDSAAEAIGAAKATTRKELARRCALGASFMLQRYDDASLHLDEIAREARMSRHHFIRTFKTVHSVTPMEYLASIRMDAALRLLKGTALSVGDVALKSGYTDRSAFYRQFVRAHGAAPTAVRNGWSKSRSI